MTLTNWSGEAILLSGLYVTVKSRLSNIMCDVVDEPCWADRRESINPGMKLESCSGVGLVQCGRRWITTYLRGLTDENGRATYVAGRPRKQTRRSEAGRSQFAACLLRSAKADSNED
jgi:hypothetical protein